MILKEILLVEANVEPEGLEYIDDWIGEIKGLIQDDNIGINHDPFMKKLRKDIINDAMGRSNLLPDDDMLQIYKTPGDPAAPGKDTDPDWVKNATDIVWTVNKESFSKLEDKIAKIFFADVDGAQGEFSRLNDLVNLEKKHGKIDPDIKRIIMPISKKYEQGKYDLAGLEKALLSFSTSGLQGWKTDKKERTRLETEAPIIMQFPDGYMWVRLDSQEEFEREGSMLQNCLHGYCPPQAAATGEGTGESRDAVYQAWKDAGKPLNDEALKNQDGSASFWLWNEREEDVGVSEPITPNLRRLMKWTEPVRKKLYPDADERWFEDDQPFGWKMGADMDGEPFQKFESIDHYMAAHIVDYEYFAADPADPEHDPDEWDQMDVPARMGGQLVYSLRDKNGESHVAVEYDRHKEKPFQMDVKGKQNDEPDAKYNKYIKALDKHWKEHPEDFGVKIDTPAESVNEGDFIPNPKNTVAIKTMSDGDFYNLSKYMGDLDKATPSEFGSPDSAAVITFQDEEEADFVLKRIKKHTGLKGDNVSGYEDPGDPGTWNDEEGSKEEEEKPLSLLGHELKRIKHLAGIQNAY